MPVPTGPNSHPVQIPSFRSVFDQDANAARGDRLQEGKSSFGSNNVSQDSRPNNLHMQPPLSPLNSPGFEVTHQHRDSTSTVASDSTDSSPTTTISTMDSTSVATESSPGSSPQSPAVKPPPAPLAVEDNLRPVSIEDSKSRFLHSSPPDLQRPMTPAKKGRNLKNLAVDTSQSFNMTRKVTTAALPIINKDEHSTSAPASPSFIKPPTPPKRTKAAALGLTIPPPVGNTNLPQQMKLAIPPTPSFKKPPMLRHFQSSPSLPLCTPLTGPATGMKLPPLGPNRISGAAFAEVPMEQEEEHDDEPNFDIPQSREEKPEAYPNGPICIYETGIDLYLEPTAEVAAKYDVVLNVASEVRNPFDLSFKIQGIPKQEEQRTPKSPEPQSAVLEVPGAFPHTPAPFSAKRNNSNSTLTGQNESSPDTPKATPLPSNESFGIIKETPSEYIHIPWEHNTDIVPDLFKLVKVIDERVQEGKRVLIHCQCGVSRSASLIVAYGLYKNPTMSVQEAYDAVKKRSKWIGPNMNLIMQLQEFRSGLMRAAADPVFYQKVYGTLPKRRASPKQPDSAFSRPPATNLESRKEEETSLTAPLRSDGALSVQMAAAGATDGIAPGPSSAPSGFAWPVDYRRSWGPNDSGTDMTQKSLPEDVPYVSPTGDVVPGAQIAVAQQRPVTSEPTEMSRVPVNIAPIRGTFATESKQRSNLALQPPSPPLMSPRATEFAMSPLSQQASPLGQFNPDDDLGLLSPRAMEFTTSPFGQAALFGHSVTQADVEKQLHAAHPPPVPVSPQSPSSNSPLQESSSPPLQSLNPKFSRPNLRDQMRLAQLQNQIEAQLPHRSPKSDASSGFGSPTDDLETLLSPRATEFTDNPFHFEISPPEASQKEEKNLEQPVPKYGAEDPRSPAQKGITPITRSIFDVL
ncbi:MAG: hypothetical protein M1821_004725 [Bathelium mastoideum]|nr:MAG: hypothetical protein M1821_004725 [Bathelium mastoideum]